VQVKPFSSSSVNPGATASYAIWVWSTGAESTGATVTVSVGSAANVEAPKFSVCPQAKGDVCTVGDLPTNQADELVAGARVRDAASAGEQITLTATAKASKSTSFHADATIGVVAASSASPSPSSAVGDTLPGTSLPETSLPALPSGAFTSPTDPSGLFPTVSPSSSASAAAGGAPKDPSHPDATTASATLPLNSRLIGGQLAGLIVLASAIAIAIARLSLRGPKSQDGDGTST
jgi:hypothetical protein